MSAVAAAAAGSPYLLRPPSWWTPVWDGPAVVLSAGLTAWYARSVRRVRRRGLPWPTARTCAWALGVLSLLMVTVVGIAARAELLLWVFTLQVLALLLLAPVLLAYGRPVALAADAMSPASAARLLRALDAPWVRRLTSPVVGPLLLPLVLSGIYFTPVLPAALQHQWAAELLQVGVLAIGLVLAFGVVGTGTEDDGSLAIGVAVAIGLLELLTDAVPGIVVRLQTHVLAPPGWAGRHRAWGPSALADQQHAGAWLWFVAEAADLPFLLILLRRWIRADERDAAATDLALDLMEQGPAAEPLTDRPWWETDPARLAGHRLAREYPPAGSGPGPTA